MTSNLVMPHDVAELSEAEHGFWNAAVDAGKAKKTLDQATGKMKTARQVMRDLLIPYSGQDESPRVRAICIAGFIVGRTGCSMDRAMEIVVDGPAKSKATKAQKTAFGSGKTIYSRARDDAKVISGSANAGNDSGKGNGREDHDTAPTPVVPNLTYGSTIVELPEYHFPSIPSVGSPDAKLAWLEHATQMALDMVESKANAGHGIGELRALLVKSYTMSLHGIREKRREIAEAKEAKKNRKIAEQTS